MRGDRLVQLVDHAGLAFVPARRREDARAQRALAKFGRQHGFDLEQRGLRAAGETLARERAHEARADDQGFELFGGEHQRRDVRALAQHVADAGFAFDRHAGELQVRDIAIDRAQRYRQRLGETPRRQRGAASAQGVDDEEQAIGATHPPMIAVRRRHGKESRSRASHATLRVVSTRPRRERVTRPAIPVRLATCVGRSVCAGQRDCAETCVRTARANGAPLPAAGGSACGAARSFDQRAARAERRVRPRDEQHQQRHHARSSSVSTFSDAGANHGGGTPCLNRRYHMPMSRSS